MPITKSKSKEEIEGKKAFQHACAQLRVFITGMMYMAVTAVP